MVVYLLCYADLILPFGAGFVEGPGPSPHASHHSHLILPFGAGFVEGLP